METPSYHSLAERLREVADCLEEGAGESSGRETAVTTAEKEQRWRLLTLLQPMEQEARHAAWTKDMQGNPLVPWDWVSYHGPRLPGGAVTEEIAACREGPPTYQIVAFTDDGNVLLGGGYSVDPAFLRFFQNGEKPVG